MNKSAESLLANNCFNGKVHIIESGAMIAAPSEAISTKLNGLKINYRNCTVISKSEDERNYFLAVLPVHPDMERRGHAGGQAQEIDLSDTEKLFLTILRKGACSTKEIVKELGLTKRTGALQRTLKGMLKKDLIRYLYPETPRHPGQKYVLNIDR